MEQKTYYVILGVSASESPTGIRAAFRDLARKLHPDAAGDEATRAFQEVQEAYEVLSDPERRREYNRRLGRFIDEPHADRSVTILGAPESIRPSFDEVYDRFLRNFTGLRVPKSEHLEPLEVEVLLTPEDAWHGGVVRIVVPVFLSCPDCGGTGRDFLSLCPSCDGRATLETEQVVRVRVPPMTRSRATVDVPLDALGIRNFFLRVHVFVSR